MSPNMKKFNKFISDNTTLITEFEEFSVMQYFTSQGAYGIRELDDEIADVERSMGEVQCQEWVISADAINTIFFYSNEISEEMKSKIAQDWNNNDISSYNVCDQYLSLKLPVVISEESR